jgi:hypothetical protein
MIAADKCTSRPECPCSLCTETRTTESARDEEDRMAEEYLHKFQASRPDFHLMDEVRRHEYMSDRFPDRDLRARRELPLRIV